MHLTITRIEIEEREGRGDVDCVFQEELTTSCASIILPIAITLLLMPAINRIKFKNNSEWDVFLLSLS